MSKEASLHAGADWLSSSVRQKVARGREDYYVYLDVLGAKILEAFPQVFKPMTLNKELP